MNIKNKKGFTLIELIAVVVVIILIFLFAFNKVRNTSNNTRMKAIKANAISYIKYLDEQSGENLIDSGDLDSTILTVSQLTKKGYKLSGKQPDGGFVEFDRFKVVRYCLEYGDFKVEDVNADNPVVDGKCTTDLAVYNFDYTGSEQEFSVPYPGLYKVEVWGAQGGGSLGGTGGYAVGNIILNENDTLYINVGGAGTSTSSGYNGGGTFGQYNGAGGATHVATISGSLKNLRNFLTDVIIVAGGGGGQSAGSGKGGTGGGFIGGNGTDGSCSSKYGTGGSQTTGGTCTANGGAYSSGFGLGGGSWGAAGGGGYYGGGVGTSGGCYGGGGGGSGYIGNADLTDKEMYCNNCTESTEEDTKTTSGSCANQTAKSDCAKKGNGYVRISYLSADIDEEDEFPSTRFLYSNGNEHTDITGGWTAYQLENGKAEKLSDALQLTYITPSGDTTSEFYTTNLVDVSHYSTLHISYEIVSTENWGTYSTLWAYAGPTAPQAIEDWVMFTSNTAVGNYEVTIDVSSLDSALVYLIDCGVNIKIYNIWLTK